MLKLNGDKTFRAHWDGRDFSGRWRLADSEIMLTFDPYRGKFMHYYYAKEVAIGILNENILMIFNS